MNQVPISTLKPLIKRKFGSPRLSQHFGATEPQSLPPTLGRPIMPAPDQAWTNFCTAYGEAVSTGYKYGIPMSAEYQTAFESKYLGAPILDGADAFGSMDAAMVYDSLPQSPTHN